MVVVCAMPCHSALEWKRQRINLWNTRDTRGDENIVTDSIPGTLPPPLLGGSLKNAIGV